MNRLILLTLIVISSITIISSYAAETGFVTGVIPTCTAKTISEDGGQMVGGNIAIGSTQNYTWTLVNENTTCPVNIYITPGTFSNGIKVNYTPSCPSTNPCIISNNTIDDTLSIKVSITIPINAPVNTTWSNFTQAYIPLNQTEVVPGTSKQITIHSIERTCGLNSNTSSITLTGANLSKISITNNGSVNGGVEISGTSWSNSSIPSTFNAGQTEWGLSSFIYGNGISLTNTSNTAISSLAPSTSESIYFGVRTPIGTPAGSYSQTITFISNC